MAEELEVRRRRFKGVVLGIQRKKSESANLRAEEDIQKVKVEEEIEDLQETFHEMLSDGEQKTRGILTRGEEICHERVFS